MFVFPRHQYLGPGNQISGDDPVDEDDIIAYLHDLSYELANNESDIEAADATAINAFIDEFRHSGNLHALLGSAGLQLKHVFESIFGVQYPSMPKNSDLNRGNKRFAAVERAIWSRYRDQKGKPGSLSYLEYKNSDATKQYRADLKKQFDAENRVTERPQQINAAETNIDSLSPSDSFGEFQEDINLDNVVDEVVFEQEDYDRLLEGLSGSKGQKRPATGQEGTGGSKKTAQSAPHQAAGPSSAMDDRQVMRQLDNVQQQMEVDQDQRGGGGGAGVSGGGGSNGAPIIIPRTLNSCKGSHTFRREWIFYSYGYNWNKLDVAAPAGFTYQCTSLAKIPVDLIGLYISPAEFNALPVFSRITNVSCVVTPLGVRTAFDHGTTITGVANTEHVPILITGTGLNKSFQTVLVSYEASATEPMIPTTAKLVAADTITEKLYGNVSGSAGFSQVLGLPRAIPSYLAITYNSQKATLPVHKYGSPELAQSCDRMLLQSVIGQPVINYSYKPKKGYLNGHKEIYIPRGLATSTALTRSAYIYPAKQTIASNGDITSAQDTYHTGFEKRNTHTMIEYDSVVWSDAKGAEYIEAQPIPYIGVLPTPPLNPGSETTQIQNTSLYFSVSTQMTITYDSSTPWTHGVLHSYSNFPMSGKKNTGYENDTTLANYYMAANRLTEQADLHSPAAHLKTKVLRKRTVHYR